MGFVQLEKMSTINFFNAPVLGGWNLMVVLWVVLAVLWLTVYFYYWQHNQDREFLWKKMQWLLLLAWLPLAVSASLSFGGYFMRNAEQIGQPLAAKQEARLCDIDNHQEFQGVLCRLYPVMHEVWVRVPAGSRLFYLSFGLVQPFLSFRLWDDYGPSVDCQQADSLLLYMTEQKIVYDENGHVLWTKKAQIGEEVIDCGLFAPPHVLTDGVFLLIRSSP